MPLNFQHSGNIGDLLASLPSARALAGGEPFNLWLKLNRPANYGKKIHPLKNTTLNRDFADSVIPLLQLQPYINEVGIYTPAKKIDFNLDKFRDINFDTSKGSIARYYELVYPCSPNMTDPWLLNVEPNPEFEGAIILNRTQRYLNPRINWEFLRKYDDTYFVGLPQEHLLLQKSVPKLRHAKTKNFLELAQIIASSRLYIGNQSSPFQVAEGLKVTRIVEVCPQCPNVIPEGPGGYMVFLQQPFERLVQSLVG